MDLYYYYYLEGFNKTLHRKLPKFNGYPTVRAFCLGALDKPKKKKPLTKQMFEFIYY